MKNTILFFSIVFAFFSCQEDEVNWSDKIIKSEKDVVAVLSVDFMDLLSKADLKNSKEMPIDQKMILNGMLSTLDSEMLGFEIEGTHRLFVVPKNAEMNGAVFIVGNIINKDQFEKTIKDLFGAEKIGKENVIFYGIEQYNSVIGFNSTNFIAGVSMDSDFAKEKISFYFEDQPYNENLAMDDYLTRDDDLSCYLSIEQMMTFYTEINSTFSQLPDIKGLDNQYGSSALIALNFNKGSMDLMGKSYHDGTMQNQFYADESVSDKYKNFLTDNDQLIAFGFANVLMNDFLKQIDQFSSIDGFNEVNRVLRNLGTSSSDISEILNGQFAISLLDVPLKKIYNSNPEFIFSMGIKNNIMFSDFLTNNGIQFGEDKIAAFKDKLFMFLDQDVFHVSTNSNLINKLKDEGALSNFTLIDENLFNKPFYLSINMDQDKLPQNFQEELLKEQKLEDLFSQIEKITFSGENKEAIFSIVFDDVEENSLYQLIDLMLKYNDLKTFI